MGLWSIADQHASGAQAQVAQVKAHTCIQQASLLALTVSTPCGPTLRGHVVAQRQSALAAGPYVSLQDVLCLMGPGSEYWAGGPKQLRRPATRGDQTTRTLSGLGGGGSRPAGSKSPLLSSPLLLTLTD